METILGIDLGTTNSEVAVIQDGKPVVLGPPDELILPSVVGQDSSGQLLVGRVARNQWMLAPERTVKSIKRLMGQETTVPMGSQRYTPQEISAIILRTLKDRAAQALGRTVTKAVITVPAFFNDGQRQATREAGQLAGLEVVRIINEPTAAALTYDPHPDKMERLLVYDLGGGTFDVSIVQIESGVVEVLSSHGDTHLGGDDFDLLLMDHVCEKFADAHGIDLRESLATRSRVLYAVEEAKKSLSFEPVVQVTDSFIVEKDGVALHLNVEVHRHDYEQLVLPLLEKTLVCVDESLSDAGLKANQIDKVVLVGGVTRTPLVGQLLEQRLGQPVHGEVEPDLCVALGAAVQAGLIAGIDVGPVLVDITPHTLGIEVLGMLHDFESDHCFAPIIRRNAALPASRTEMFNTVSDGQEAAIMRVFQGEEADTRHNDLVGEFLLEGLADVDAGNEITVRFDLDLNGILKVTATERTTGLSKQLTIDNAMERFRQQGRVAANQRLNAIFGQGENQPGAASDAAAASDPALEAALADALKLLSSAEQLLAEASPDDALDLERTMEQVRAAIEARSADQVRQALPELEDLLFYLQDA